jgi:GcrA cell cycle regulator
MNRADEKFEWTDAAVATLCRLWAEGHSASEIGRRMGVSKNAVVGKAHRLDLSARPTPIRTRDPSKPKPERRPRAPKSSLPSLPSLEEAAPAPTIGTGVRHCIEREPAIAEEHDPAVTGDKPCRWPIGNPGTPGFRFCEAPALVGKPYCPEHAELAYVQTRNRRDDGQQARRPGDLTLRAAMR